MAKQAAPAPDAAEAPAPKAAKPAQSRASKTAAIQSIAQEIPSDNVKWGNGGPAGSDDLVFDEPKVDKVELKPEEPAEETPAEEPADEEEKTPADKPPPKETAAEKRARALAALGAESKARKLEKELKALQEQHEKASKMTLGEMLAARGTNKDELLEKLLAGTDDLGLPAKLEGDKADIAALKAELADVKTKLKAQEDKEQSRQVQDALKVVADTVKDADLPLVNSYPGAHERVMTEAFNAWKADGEQGTPRDYLQAAAEVVEETLRKENPGLAKLADAGRMVKAAKPKGDKTEDAAAAMTAPPTNGITRRTAARPNAQPAKLPDDPQERDNAIKRQFGWS